MRRVNISVVGDCAVGKSSLITRFVENKFLTLKVYYECAVKTIECNNEAIEVNVYDARGNDRFQSQYYSNIRKADGIFIVFDRTYPQSFESLAKWMQIVEYFAPAQAIKILLGNKTDLILSTNVQKIVNQTVASEWAQSAGIEYIETSAKESINVDLAFHRLIKKITNNDLSPSQNVVRLV